MKSGAELSAARAKTPCASAPFTAQLAKTSKLPMTASNNRKLARWTFMKDATAQERACCYFGAGKG